MLSEAGAGGGNRDRFSPPAFSRKESEEISHHGGPLFFGGVAWLLWAFIRLAPFAKEFGGGKIKNRAGVKHPRGKLPTQKIQHEKNNTFRSTQKNTKEQHKQTAKISGNNEKRRGNCVVKMGK